MVRGSYGINNDTTHIDYFELEGELLESGVEDDLQWFSGSLQDNWPLQSETQSKFKRVLGAPREDASK